MHFLIVPAGTVVLQVRELVPTVPTYKMLYSPELVQPLLGSLAI